MTNYRYKICLVVVLLVVVASACKKQWDDRTAITDQQLDKTVMQQISENASLSVFAGYLNKFGYDKVLASSRNYTVWAPTNTALQGLDQAIVNDTASLHKFVDNHIATQVYLTTTVNGSMRIKTLNGKNVTFTANSVEDATITTANQYVKNGVVHVIDKALKPKMNIWEYVKSLTSQGLLHQDYLKKQDTTFVDTTKATVKSIDPATGKPILVAGTGVVTINKYFNRVANLGAEDSTYTYFVLTDAAYNAERAKVSKYFATVTNSTDTTMNILAAFNVLKDVAVRGAVQPANLPAVMQSVNGVNVPVDKSAIVATYNASNGIVYVVNSMNFAIADKITPVTIQAERPSFFMRTDQNSRILYRARLEPNTNVRFTDMLITGSGLPAQFFAAYKISGLNTCQYRVVMRSLNDTLQTKQANISQRVLFGQVTAVTTAAGVVTPTFAITFPYSTIPVYNYNEVTLTGATGSGATMSSTGGTLNVTKWSSVNMYVQGANSTTANANNILFDYIKLIPVIQ